MNSALTSSEAHLDHKRLLGSLGYLCKAVERGWQEPVPCELLLLLEKIPLMENKRGLDGKQIQSGSSRSFAHTPPPNPEVEPTLVPSGLVHRVPWEHSLSW